MQFIILQCTAIYYTAVHCNLLQCTAIYCSALQSILLQCTAIYFTVLHCNLLQCTKIYCTAVHCNLLQCTAIYCTALYFSANAFEFQNGISLEFDARMWCYNSLWTWPSGRWSFFVELDMCECDVLFLSDGHRNIAIDPSLLLIEAHFEGLLMFDTLFHLSVIPVRLPGCLFF